VYIEKTRYDKCQTYSKSAIALLYKTMSKERRKRNPPTPNNHSLYTVPQPPYNHSPCSDTPFKFSCMILHTTNESIISTTTPYHLVAEQHRPLLYLTKLLYHHHRLSSHNLHINLRFLLFVTPMSSQNSLQHCFPTLIPSLANLSFDKKRVMLSIESI